MAQFKTHMAGGALVAAGISSAALFTNMLTLAQAGAVFMEGFIASLLPDLDCDTGKPLKFLFQLVSILIPSIIFLKISQYVGDSPEFLICYFTISYLFFSYIVCSLVKKITVHRGMMHSLPFAALCGAIMYLLFSASGKQVAIVAALTAFLCCLVHLLLDEYNSIKFKFGFIPSLKQSRGTALKLKSNSILTTIFIYTALTIAIASSIVYS
jgi:membrane-bound metal-dependent hydrolase YbcI (DUF457 family)